MRRRIHTDGFVRDLELIHKRKKTMATKKRKPARKTPARKSNGQFKRKKK